MLDSGLGAGDGPYSVRQRPRQDHTPASSSRSGWSEPQSHAGAHQSGDRGGAIDDSLAMFTAGQLSSPTAPRSRSDGLQPHGGWGVKADVEFSPRTVYEERHGHGHGFRGESRGHMNGGLFWGGCTVLFCALCAVVLLAQRTLSHHGHSQPTAVVTQEERSRSAAALEAAVGESLGARRKSAACRCGVPRPPCVFVPQHHTGPALREPNCRRMRRSHRLLTARCYVT